MRILLVIGALAGVAHADGDRALSYGGGVATFAVPGKAMPGMTPPSISPDGGLMLDGAFQYGISSDISLHAEAMFAGFHGGAQKGQSDTSYATFGDAGVLFKFDVLKWAPYAFAGIGGIVAGGGPIDTDTTFVLAIGGGVEISSSRERSWGLEARLASFAGNITVFTLEAHRSVRWGFF